MRAAYSSSASAAAAQQVNGNLIANTRRFVLKHYDENAWQEVLLAMPPAHRETVASVVPIGWYDCFTYDLLNQHVAQVLGPRRPDDVLQALGRFTAEQDFGGIHRLFLRLVTPNTVFEQLPRIWGRYQQGGEWVVEKRGEAEWLGTQKDCDVSSEATCIRVQGFVQRVGEMTSQRGLRVERPMCRLRGDPHCQLLARWLA
jgi:hypothetical protein